jgi:hypothetical protein
MNLHEPGGASFDETWVKPNRFWRLVKISLLCLLVWSVAAYFLLPLAWQRVSRHHHPALEDTPRITQTRDGIRGDPINIALVGTEEEVVTAMLKAMWLPADPITLRSSLRIASGTIRSRPYETAPVSDLFVWGRKQDLAFQQPIGKNPRRRHHVRFWRSDALEYHGQLLWVGAATLDISVGLSRTTAQITHHIDADVDAERDKLLDDLEKTNLLAGIDWVEPFHKQLEGRNGGGDRWYTDGRLPVVIMKRVKSHAHSATGTMAVMLPGLVMLCVFTSRLLGGRSHYDRDAGMGI